MTQRPGVDAIPERMDARRLAVWVVVLLLALYLVFVGGGWQGIYTAAIRQVTVALAGLGLGAWAIVAGVCSPEKVPEIVSFVPVSTAVTAPTPVVPA